MKINVLPVGPCTAVIKTVRGKAEEVTGVIKEDGQQKYLVARHTKGLRRSFGGGTRVIE